MTKLTKNQKFELAELKRHGVLYVGHNCPTIFRTYDILVKKGLVKVVRDYGNGKDFDLV